MKCSKHRDMFVRGCPICEDLAKIYNYPLLKKAIKIASKYKKVRRLKNGKNNKST